MDATGAIDRRRFLRQAACGAVGYTAVSGAVLDLLGINAAAQAPAGDYRALVCVFLYGGNDANNLVVPRSGEPLANYQAARGGLAIDPLTLLPIAPVEGDGREYGLHPSLPGLQALFEGGRAALVSNVGPLVAPMTRQQYLDRSVAAPRQLFSHSDQQAVWQSSIPDGPATSGWGGRTADLVRSLNGAAHVSMSISLGGTNTFQVGRDVFQYPLTTSGPVALSGYQPPPSTDPESRAIDRILALQNRNIFERAYRDTVRGAIETQQVVQAALASVPALTTVFPTTRIGQQLAMAARTIGARGALGHRRQVFFCATGGYDTHTGQVATQATLFAELDAALAAFYAATVELGVAAEVTTFTASDFGRTFRTNGSGSDHGWGSHHVVIGGAVRGRRMVGRYPTLVVNGPDDTGLGRWIPAVSVDEYGATLARWFGVAASDLSLVFPNLGRFAQPDLGFLG